MSIEKNFDDTKKALDQLRRVAEENRQLRSENLILKLETEARARRDQTALKAECEVNAVRDAFIDMSNRFRHDLECALDADSDLVYDENEVKLLIGRMKWIVEHQAKTAKAMDELIDGTIQLGNIFKLLRTITDERNFSIVKAAVAAMHANRDCDDCLCLMDSFVQGLEGSINAVSGLDGLVKWMVDPLHLQKVYQHLLEVKDLSVKLDAES